MYKLENSFHWMMTVLLGISMTGIYYSSLTSLL